MKPIRKARETLKWLRILGLLAFGFALMIAASIGGLMVQYPVRSALWHCTHGKYVYLGKNQLKLPLLWWHDRDEDVGTIVLMRGVVDDRIAFMPSELHLTPQKPGKTIKDDQSAEAIQNKLVSKTRFVPIIITAPVGKIYCVRDQSNPRFSALFCFSAKVPWNLNFFPGSGDNAQAEGEAESILATLK